MKLQKEKLDSQVIELLSIQGELKAGQETLNKKLDPFISYAHRMFPDVGTDQALSKLKDMLEEQSKRLDQTDKKVEKIEGDVAAEKTRSKPSLKLKTWNIKNERVTKIPKQIVHSRDTFDTKEKFNLDYLVFNQIEFTYGTEINKSEFVFLLNKNDVVYCLIGIKNGRIQFQGVSSSDGKKGFRLTQPENGDYILRIYSKTDLTTLDQLLLN